MSDIASNFHKDKINLLKSNRSKKGRLGASSKTQGNTLLSMMVGVSIVYALLTIL